MRPPPRKRNTARDFWARVERGSSCWLWRGAVNSNGHGQMCFEGVREAAQRIAWRLQVDPHLDPETTLYRWCDTSGCVNPAHYKTQRPGRRAGGRADEVAA